MAADHPDVLDHLGLTPRELGAVQVHFEPVLVDADRRAHVTALLQPAFDGRLDGRLLPTALTPGGDRAVEAGLSLPLPRLQGKVLRWRFSFPLLAVPEEILFRLEAPVPPGAQRVRAAWRLLDTVEQPKEVRQVSAALLEDGGTDALGFGVHFALGLAMGHVTIPVGWVMGSVLESDGPSGSVLHAAPADLAGFVAPVVLGAAPAPGPELELIWEQGMALPQAPQLPAPPVALTVQPSRAVRPCPACGLDIDVAQAERERMCPNCATPWSYS